ncbi:MAG: hypothetical protein J6T67_01995 [Paludibacteraceae bacterium]|nr:hypothetical protein [Paludibacteraceae bacterium]MBR5374286.1 hypothetical protein [Paludibacteraceae bacterium]
MNPLDASDFLPQRAPFLLVDRLLECNQHFCCTNFAVPADHPMVRDGRLSEGGVLENIAQTCATHIGYLSRHLPIRIGVVASVKNVEINFLPKIGAHLETTVEEQGEPIFSVSIYVAKVYSEGALMAQGEMRVVLTDQIPTEQ